MINVEVPITYHMFKVIQLYLGRNREPWLIGKDTEKPFAKLLEDILTEKQIQVVKHTTHGREVPALENPDQYSVAGFGTCRLIHDTYHFFDTSWEHRKKIDEPHLQQLQKLNPDFIYEVHRNEEPEPPLRVPPRFLQ